MKKLLSILLIISLCFGLTLMSGCSGSKVIKHPYEELNLDEYIKLVDYDKLEVKTEEVQVSEEEVQKQIDYILSQAGTSEKITEGTVKQGDVVNISFKGTLEDGTTNEGMQSDGYRLTLGSGGMIEGFEEGLYGATIGKPVTLDLKFPDPYTNSPDLAGKGVTFEVTVLNKEVSVPAELNVEFVKNNSEYETVEEYRENLKKEYTKLKEEQAVNTAKKQLSTDLLDKTEVIKYPEGDVDKTVAKYKKLDETAAKTAGQTFEEYVKQYYGLDVDKYEESLKSYGEMMVKANMVFCAISKKENIQLTQEIYDKKMDEFLKSTGAEDEKAFKEKNNMSLEEAADIVDLRLTALSDEIIDKLYEKLNK